MQPRMGSSVAIMQPYIFPYIGYFQLIKAAEQFVIYDNIQYTKKGWINRNRILINGKDEYISIPLKNDSDYLDVKDRVLAESWSSDRNKLLNRISGAYKKAPNFDLSFSVIERCVLFETNNLFQFIHNSIAELKQHLGITTPLIISSSVNIDHSLKNEKRVLAICKQLNATTYINPEGGTELYDKEHFRVEDIDLKFIKSNKYEYRQFSNTFIPFLSIIDVMMFNSLEETKRMIGQEFTIQ